MLSPLQNLVRASRPKNPLPALLLLAYVISCLLGPMYLSLANSAYLLIGLPLLFASLISFQKGKTWGWIGSGIWTFAYWLLWWPALKIMGGVTSIIWKLWEPTMKFVFGRKKKGDSLKPAIPKLTKSSREAQSADFPDEDLVGEKTIQITETEDEAETLTPSTDEVSHARYSSWLKKVRPRFWVQAASVILYIVWIALWVSPILPYADSWLTTNRWWLLFAFPLCFSFFLAAVEHADNYFKNWDFPILKVLLGLILTPVYWAIATVVKLTILRPKSINRTLAKVPILERAYYPTLGFLLTARRYLLFLATVATCAIISLVIDGNPWVTVVAFLLLILLEWVRLTKQLADVKFLGVSDLSDFSKLIESSKTGLKKDSSDSPTYILRKKVYLHAMAQFSKRIMESAKPETSYLITVTLILIKHVFVIGIGLAGVRYFYVNDILPIDSSCSIESFFELLANSFVLLFGEVTFGDCGAFLSYVNLVGVASSFLLLGLGLTYLSGRAESAYIEEYKQLQTDVANYEASGIPEELSEKVEHFDKVGISGLFGLVLGF